MEELLYRYNPWWEGEYELRGIIERDSHLRLMEEYLDNRNIVFLTGLRRAGKTTLLKLFILKLIREKRIAPEKVFYISMDDYLISGKTILDIIEEYRKILKLPFREKVYLFLDEVAYIKDFELQLKNLHDFHNAKIFASSSNASVLRSKKPFLTGRNIIIEVLPLDFDEFLKFKKINISKQDSHLFEGYFEEYLKTGGMPEYVLTGNMECLKELVSDIIYKDIVTTYRIKNPDTLKDFFLLLMERAGKQLSINKIARLLSISPDSARRYLQMFEETYLVYLVPRFGKTNERILAPKKVYASDLGIRNLFTGFRDKGALFENYIYLKIKSRKPSYIYKEGIEIDFLTEDNTLIEVKYRSELTEKQKKFFSKFKAKKKIIIRNFHDLKKIE